LHIAPIKKSCIFVELKHTNHERNNLPKLMKSKALERAGEADRVKCCVQTDRVRNLIPALFFYE